MKIVEVPIGDLEVSENNPRSVKSDAFRKLMQSIKRDDGFMMARPILAYRKDGRSIIYAGTQRYLACKELGWLKVPCVVEANLTDEIVHDRMLRDNYNNGRWDDKMLMDNFDVSTLDFFDLKTANKKGLNILDGIETVDLGKATHDTVGANTARKKAVGEHNFNIVFGSLKTKRRVDELIDDVRGEYNFEVALMDKITALGIA